MYKRRGERGCSLSRRRHLLLLQSVLPSPPPLHLILHLFHLFFFLFSLSFIIFLFFFPPLSHLLILDSFSLSLSLRFSLRSAFTKAERRIETRHSKRISHALMRRGPNSTRFPVNLAGEGALLFTIQQSGRAVV